MSMLNPNCRIRRGTWVQLHKNKEVIVEKAVEPIVKSDNDEPSFDERGFKNRNKEIHIIYDKRGRIDKRYAKGQLLKKA